MTDNAVNFKNMLECEFNPRKREWLKEFSKPEMLMDDVCKLSKAQAYNFMTDLEEDVPLDVFLFCFGFSCKDLSSLNNHAHSYKSDCVETGAGSTGATWRGNCDFLGVAKPPLALIENVRAARKGPNFEQMKKDLAEVGYVLADLLLNAALCGFPQDRERAWFAAIRKDLCSPEFPNDFYDLVDLLQLPEPMPLSRFILADSHPYVEQHFANKRKQALKKRQKQQKVNSKCGIRNEKKKKVNSKCGIGNEKKKKVRSGKQWVVDHWRVRRELDMLAVDSSEEPEVVSQAAQTNALCDRERDLFRLIVEAPTGRDSEMAPAIEMKHSASRVVSHKGQKRHKRCTSCLLPASKIMILPPMSRSPRFLTGLEALSLQGVPCEFHTATTNIMSDAEYMSLAGNAFNAGCCALVLLAALSTMRMSPSRSNTPQ